jgi:hypothetical protein
MNRFIGATIVLACISLAAYASQTPPPAPPQLPSERPTPQSSVEQPFFTQTGLASFYGASQDGKTTADGHTFDQRGFTAAHRALAFGTVVRVTNMGHRAVGKGIDQRPRTPGQKSYHRSIICRRARSGYDGEWRCVGESGS